MLISYASNPEVSKGRKIFELQDLYRNNFEKDRERIIHSNSFKRLEYKTQVFVNDQNDHYRNRLTHSLEVAGIARIVAKKLSLNEDLAECIALAHDMGHTPFGHAGEEALNKCMEHSGGFCHNAFSIKLLDKLEKRYASFDGLNLSWEVIEGIAKHNGPVDVTDKAKAPILDYDKQFSLDLGNYSSAEAQIASISDDIAYNSHDIEDGLRAKMFTLEDLAQIAFFQNHIEQLKVKYKNAHTSILSYEISRIFTKTLVHDLIDNSSNNFYNYKIKDVADIRTLGQPIVTFSAEKARLLKQVGQFLYDNFYSQHQAISFKCRKIITSLFELYMANPCCLPKDWQNQLEYASKEQVISDYIAGMTDRYAIKEFESFFHLTAQNL
jgi:dGTPase